MKPTPQCAPHHPNLSKHNPTAPPTHTLPRPPQDKFDALLPLYLSAPHFNRALPHMAHLLPLLAPEAVGAGGRAPPPETWLTVLAAILNTQVGGWCGGQA